MIMRFYRVFIAALLGFAGLCFPAFAADMPTRVVTVGAPATEIVFALGAGETVVATDTTSTWPEKVKTLPKVGYMRNLAAEGIISLKPDRVIAVAESGPMPVLDDLQALGIPVTILPFLATFENLPDAIMVAATALGREDQGQVLVHQVKADIAAIEDLADTNTARSKRKKIVFLMSVGHGQPMSAGAHTTANEIIGLIGGENPMAGYDGFKPVSPEIIAADGADYVMVTSSTLDQLGGLAGLQAHPVLGLHKAVAAGHVLTVSASTILGFGPRSAAEIRDLATQIHQYDAGH
jgi:iron complex transport system substrate-binding protein